MRTIICKKCGAEIDAALGECPNCGTVYYILPTEEDKKLEWAMTTEPDDDGTQVFGNNEANKNRGAAAHSTRDILNADNDELFNTRVWKISDEQDGAKPVRTQATEKLVRPVNRPVRQEIKTEVPRTSAGNNQPPQKNNKGILKNPLFVSGVALLAVLTLVLSVMGGLFNFSGKDEGKDKMPYVVGMMSETATTLLEGMGLDVKSTTEENEAVAGTVIEQSIKEGKKVKEGDKVTIVVSSGSREKPSEAAEYIDVPDLKGKTFDEARKALTELGLNITPAADAFSDEDVGKIISQSPLKGAKLKTGDLVTVTISKGPETTEYVITVTAGKGGTISPKGIVNVTDGENQTFIITADNGYEVREVKVDGTDIGPVTSYSFEKVTDDHTLYVVFAKKGAASPSPSPTKPVSGTDITA